MADNHLQLTERDRKDAIASIQRYFDGNLPEPIGDLPAGMLLDYILEEIGPAVYNKGVADAQARMAARVADIEGELYTDAFQYWNRLEQKRKRR